jgi:hypothetical protein
MGRSCSSIFPGSTNTAALIVARFPARGARALALGAGAYWIVIGFPAPEQRWRRDSTRVHVTFGEAFAAQLFASHLRDKSFEINTCEIFADMSEPVLQILVDAILSALTALGIGVGGAQHTLPACSNPVP